MSRKKENLFIFLGMAVALGIIFFVVAQIVPSNARSTSLHQGSAVVRGTVTKIPIETESGVSMLEFGSGGRTYRARLPNECGDDIAVGTEIEVWVDTWRSDGIAITESEPPVYAQEAFVKCRKVWKLTQNR